MKRQIWGCKGYTLIEVLLVMGLAAVSLGLAAPAFSALQGGLRVSGATDTFFADLALTRSEAIKRNARVVMCKSADGANCTRSGSWQQGWILFHDANNNAMLDMGEAVLRRERALPASLSLAGNSPVASYISYTALGHTSLTSGGLQMGTLTVCQKSAAPVEARQIVISTTGRARVKKTNVANCA